MNLKWMLNWVLAVLTVLNASTATAAVQLAVPRKAEPFDLRDVRLLEGPFKHAQDKDGEHLLTLEPDRLLAWFRKEAGLAPKAPAYGGWEIKDVAGHSAGHYLSACSMMWQATGDRRFLERVNSMVNELAICQMTNGNGYLAAIPNGKRVFSRIAQGEVIAEPFYLNDVWVPWYTIHKTLAGLRDAYLLCDNTNALQVALGLADWAAATTENLSERQWQKMLACEHGGMMEVLTDLYALSSERKYLALAKSFYHNPVLDALTARQDKLAEKHANTQIPKLIGCARLYELTGEMRYITAARFFWETVTRRHSYVTGGNSDDERFGKPGRLNERLSDKTAESCNTYNMLKLTKALFCNEPSANLADYYERALWNHILASQNPASGMVCYYLPLRPGARKEFLTPFESFACCGGTGMESHARYGEAIYFHGANTFYLNQFIASEASWHAKGMRIRQETDFPNKGLVRLVIACEKPVTATIKVRHPFWANDELRIRINGTDVNVVSTPQSYAALDREWHDGDQLEVTLPMRVRTEAMPDNPKRIAFLYGPIVLAADMGTVGRDRLVPVMAVGTRGSFLDKTPRVTMVTVPEQRLMPVIAANARPVQEWLATVVGRQLVFRTAGIAKPNDLELLPLYQIHDRRYSVYWDVCSEKEWKAREPAYHAEQRRLQTESLPKKP